VSEPPAEIRVTVKWFSPKDFNYGFCTNGTEDSTCPSPPSARLALTAGSELIVAVMLDPTGRPAKVVRKILFVDKTTALATGRSLNASAPAPGSSA
jgi:hypothetical protein